MKRLTFLLSVSILMLATQCTNAQKKPNPYYSRTSNEALKVSDAEWKKILPANVYNIARERGTERPFTGKYANNHAKGIYYCAVCGHPLFRSETKFESGTGWPSFYEPLHPNSVSYHADHELGTERTEVVCTRCFSHLGHVFDDGPKPTGKRFCMNSAVLEFVPDH